MATTENLPSATSERPIGFGRLKRKEDARRLRLRRPKPMGRSVVALGRFSVAAMLMPPVRGGLVWAARWTALTCSCAPCSGRSPRSPCGSRWTGRGLVEQRARRHQHPGCRSRTGGHAFVEALWIGSSRPSPRATRPCGSRGLGHHRERRARLHRLAVDEHDAGAAVRRVAAPVGPVRPSVSRMKCTSSRRGSTSWETCSPLMVIETFMLRPPAAARGGRAAQRALGEHAGEVALVVDRPAAVRAGEQSSDAIAPACANSSSRRRLAAQQLLGAGQVDRRQPDRAERDAGVGDRAAVEPHRRRRGGDRPVAGAALDLLVRAAAPGRTLEPHLGEDLAVPHRRHVRADVEVLHRARRARRRRRGSRRSPWRRCRRPRGPRPASAWHSEPPIVPRLRTTGSAITCSASRNSGKRSASSSDFSRSTCRVSAPIRISPSSSRM